jgi:hypothetical protein
VSLDENPPKSVFRLEVRFEELGGEGVAIVVEDCAVERDEAEGMRRCLPGVENSDAREPREISGWVPDDVVEISPCSADIGDIWRGVLYLNR